MVVIKRHRPVEMESAESKQEPVRILGHTDTTWSFAAMSFFLISTLGVFASVYFTVMLIPALICLVLSGSLNCVYQLLCPVEPGQIIESNLRSDSTPSSSALRARPLSSE